MKRLILPVLSLLLFTLSGCATDDGKQQMPSHPLAHQWTLIHASGDFAGAEYDFEEGVVIWNFKYNGTVEIENNNTDESKPNILDSGTYDFQITNNPAQIEGCDQSLRVDTYTFYCYSINTDGQLILDDSPVDGMKYTFVRADLIP